MNDEGTIISTHKTSNLLVILIIWYSANCQVPDAITVTNFLCSRPISLVFLYTPLLISSIIYNLLHPLFPFSSTVPSSIVVNIPFPLILCLNQLHFLFFNGTNWCPFFFYPLHHL